MSNLQEEKGKNQQQTDHCKLQTSLIFIETVSRMKKILSYLIIFFISTQLFAQSYVPSPQNLKAREWFSDARFGLFIHWGPFSIPGQGEWVMNNLNITVKNYTRLENFFNPIEFDAQKWVAMA